MYGVDSCHKEQEWTVPNDNALVVKTNKLPTEESLQAKSESDISEVSP